MDILEKILQVYQLEPNFEERALQLIFSTPIDLTHFESRYMARYNLGYSPLIQCTYREKAIVLMTLPNINIIESTINHPTLGIIKKYKVSRF